MAPEPGTRLANKTVVVTGASSGFGRGIALALAGHDASVVVAARVSHTLTEAAIAAVYHHEQMEQAPPAANTSGTLHDASGEGDGVDGGNKERIALEIRRGA
jgi:NAD(P)-dependent dehydrogenase (short-subunit alcohol dehydrogenase family)